MKKPLTKRSAGREPHSGNMKIFIIWSGEPSQKVALALRDWLPSVLPFAKPWISSEDIEKGARWNAEIASNLDATEFGIICVVPGNLTQPWLNFEAGAVSKSIETGRVAPLLVKVIRSEVEGPLQQFQLTLFAKEDVRRLIHSINRNASSPLPADRLKQNFDRCWPSLKDEIEAIDFSTHGPARSSEPPVPRAEVPDEHLQIMKLIAECGDYKLYVDDIAGSIKQNKTRTEHYLDQLVARDLLHDIFSYTGSQTTYGLTEAGRALLVEKDLV